MKRSGFNHRKIKRLAIALGIPIYASRGIAESLWHVTAAHARQGNIGILTNQEIADEIGWDKSADALIDALVAVELIDRCTSKHRLIVHDWDEHADQAVSRALSKEGLSFIKPVLVQAQTSSQLVPIQSETSSQLVPIQSQTSLPEPEPEPEPGTAAPFALTAAKPQRQGRQQRIGWSAASGFVGVDEESRSRWREAFPSVDIDGEMRRATAWLAANPTRAGKRNWAKFITGWLSRTHERGGPRAQSTGQQAASGWDIEAMKSATRGKP